MRNTSRVATVSAMRISVRQRLLPSTLAPITAGGYGAVPASGRHFRACGKALAQPAGLVGVPCICRCCGCTRIFTAGAGQIPIGPRYDTELVRAPAPGPPTAPSG